MRYMSSGDLQCFSRFPSFTAITDFRVESTLDPTVGSPAVDRRRPGTSPVPKPRGLTQARPRPDRRAREAEAPVAGRRRNRVDRSPRPPGIEVEGHPNRSSADLVRPITDILSDRAVDIQEIVPSLHL